MLQEVDSEPKPRQLLLLHDLLLVITPEPHDFEQTDQVVHVVQTPAEVQLALSHDRTSLFEPEQEPVLQVLYFACEPLSQVVEPIIITCV